jgi:AraC-like DNA-binding protein
MPSFAQAHREQELTWQRFRSWREPRVLRDAWPKVLPLPGGGPGNQKAPKPSAAGAFAECSQQAWLTALTAFDELSSYRDLDTLLRRSVELLRSALGLERAAIFLLRDGTHLCGTFGTGPCAETTDERHISFELGQSHREAFALCSQGLAQWSRFPNVPLFAQESNRTVVLRTGENVIVPIPSRRSCLGLVACDNGVSGSSIDTDTLIRTAVFARVLGPLLIPKVQAHELRVHEDAVARELPASARCELVGAAIRHLRLDPNEPRERLAKALGTTADRLGRAFKAEMGESLPEYRNKVRLQRFFSLVDPNGGNLLASALAAGFGSYAQFNRVFHHCYDSAPIGYLRQRQGPANPSSEFGSVGATSVGQTLSTADDSALEEP